MPKQIYQLLFASLLSSYLLTGCQIVNVKSQGINVTIAKNVKVSLRNKLSEASLNVLSMTGREAKICSTTNPTSVFRNCNRFRKFRTNSCSLPPAKCYLAKALEFENSSDCKTSTLASTRSEEKQKQQQETYDQCLDQQLYMLDKSIRYSYAYMFKTKRQPKDRIFDNRQVQIRDFII